MELAVVHTTLDKMIIATLLRREKQLCIPAVRIKVELNMQKDLEIDLEIVVWAGSKLNVPLAPALPVPVAPPRCTCPSPWPQRTCPWRWRGGVCAYGAASNVRAHGAALNVSLAAAESNMPVPWPRRDVRARGPGHGVCAHGAGVAERSKTLQRVRLEAVDRNRT